MKNILKCILSPFIIIIVFLVLIWGVLQLAYGFIRYGGDIDDWVNEKNE
jgi:hypothetical protein